jgi:MoaA/NifB/PqqE/SkfB family radical SAM enzyme
MVNRMEGRELSDLLSSRMIDLFGKGRMIVARDPGLAPFALKTLIDQRKAAGRRKELLERGTIVPPFMIVSVTNRCNLDCKGCYAKKFRNGSEREMDRAFLEDLLKQGRELGISIVMMAGGEPLLREDIIDIMEEFPEIIFPLFTNGMLLDDETLRRLKRAKHIIPVLSFEGFGPRTDMRRGKGVYESLMEAAERLDRSGLVWGTSLTVTRSNFDEVTDPAFIETLNSRGSRLFFFVEYIPVAEGSECEVPMQEQRERTVPITEDLAERFPGIFIAFPGDEEIFGGCLSSGRGFVHINPQGELEPCPFAPYSDTNLHEMSLEEALKSSLLKEIRENHHMLEETSGGCALWRNKDWVKGLMKEP